MKTSLYFNKQKIISSATNKLKIINIKGRTLNKLLNIALSTEWKNNVDNISCTPEIASWLVDQASLTKKLEAKTEKFSVEVKLETKTDAKQDVLSSYFPSSETVLVREVLLKCNQVANVFAQTEIPQQTISSKYQQLEHIGEESLGKFLFQEKSLKRGKIEVAEFLVGSPIHQLCESLQQTCNHSLWARRSIFYIENNPLLVTEVFLPASGIYQ